MEPLLSPRLPKMREAQAGCVTRDAQPRVPGRRGARAAGGSHTLLGQRARVCRARGLSGTFNGSCSLAVPLHVPLELCSLQAPLPGLHFSARRCACRQTGGHRASQVRRQPRHRLKRLSPGWNVSLTLVQQHTWRSQSNPHVARLILKKAVFVCCFCISNKNTY